MLAVLRLEEFASALAERAPAFAQRQQPAHPPEQRVRVVRLRLHVDRFVVIFRIVDDRQVKALRIGAGEAGVLVRAPLHRRAHAVAVAQVDVFAHADFVAVIKHRGAGQGEEERVQQLDASAVVAQQRGQAAADAEIEPGLVHVRIHAIHVIALLVGHHFQGQFVVVAQEQRPLAGLGNGRRLLENIHDRHAVLHAQRP